MKADERPPNDDTLPFFAEDSGDDDKTVRRRALVAVKGLLRDEDTTTKKKKTTTQVSQVLSDLDISNLFLYVCVFSGCDRIREASVDWFGAMESSRPK